MADDTRMTQGTGADDNIQHGIDDDPNNDAQKGAALGGLGGAVVGALAGSAAGPVGTVVGAVVGGLGGAGASGLAVGAVDQMDNDNTVSGVGGGATTDVNTTIDNATTGGVQMGNVTGTVPNTNTGVNTIGGGSLASSMGTGPDVSGPDIRNAGTGVTSAGGTDMNADVLPGNNVPGVQTGGITASGHPDSRGITEKAADALTGDHTDDKTGEAVGNVGDSVRAGASNTGHAVQSGVGAASADLSQALPGNNVPGVQTGGTTVSGHPDSRGITEKVADAVTGDHTDDKTGEGVGNIGDSVRRL